MKADFQGQFWGRLEHVTPDKISFNFGCKIGFKQIVQIELTEILKIKKIKNALSPLWLLLFPSVKMNKLCQIFLYLSAGGVKSRQNIFQETILGNPVKEGPF